MPEFEKDTEKRNESSWVSFVAVGTEREFLGFLCSSRNGTTVLGFPL